MSKKTKIALVDDHLLFREGLRDLLADRADFEIVGEAADGREALSIITKNAPDVLLIDLRMPKMGGVPVIRQARESHPQMKIIVISMYEDEDTKREAYLAGADAYHSKMDGAQQVIGTIRALVSGKSVVDPDYLKKLRESAETQLDVMPSTLTATEHRLLDELSKGRPNKDLADMFAMSERTVKNHLNSIFKKLGVKSRLEAVRKAVDKKWISLES